MVELPRIISKKVWFLIFNVGTIIYLIANGSLHWDAISIVSYGLALLIMNGIALISARKYKGWK
jgi:hypothetical protein